MKEYKVEFVRQSMNPNSHSKKISTLLNQMGEQGWEFRSNSGLTGYSTVKSKNYYFFFLFILF